MPNPSKVISIRIKPRGQVFVATIIGEVVNSRTVGEVSVLEPKLVQRVGATERDAATAALDALFNHDPEVAP